MSTRKYYNQPEIYTGQIKPIFKIGDEVITNDYHWQEARNMFGNEAKFIKKPTKITKIHIIEDAKYPIMYELDTGKFAGINEIFLKKAIN